MSHAKRKRQGGGNDKGIPVKSIIIGAAVGAVLFFALMLAASATALKSDINAKLYPVIGMAVAGVAAFAGGFAAVRPHRKNGVPFGALTGVIIAIIAAVSAFAANSASAGGKLFLLMGIIILMASAGGVAATNLRKKSKL